MSRRCCQRRGMCRARCRRVARAECKRRLVGGGGWGWVGVAGWGRWVGKGGWVRWVGKVGGCGWAGVAEGVRDRVQE